MRLTYFTAIIVALSTVTSNAEQIDLNAAKRTAERYMRSDVQLKSNKTSDKLTLAYTAQSNYNEDENCYYVFNRSNGGFVIAAADDCAQQILGVSDEGSFDYENIPENMRWWLDSYTQQISLAMQEGANSANESAIQKAARGRISVNPLCTTKWNQGKYYNDECPVINGKSTYTGCVATALAQVMKYHNWPERGIGSISYKNDYTDAEEISANFEESAYDWNNMPDQLDANSTPEQVKAVAHLMYQCGISVYTTYGTSGSSAYMKNIVKLYKHFGYSKSVSYRERDMFTDAEWEKIIYNEISNNRPVCYSGGAQLDRHAFVCDGYNADDNTFHFNWGWSGNGNGYFKLSALEPFGESKTHYVYNQMQGVIIGIQKPTAENNFLDTPIVATGNLNAKKSGSYVFLCLDKNDDGSANKFRAVADYASSADDPDVYDNVRMKMVNVDTKEVTYATTESKFKLYNGLNDNNSFGKNWKRANDLFPIGTSYEVTPEYKTSDSNEWKPVLISEKYISKVIITRNTDGTFTFEQVKSPANLNIDEVNVDKAVAGRDILIDLTLSNLGQSDYSDDITLSLVDAQGEKAATFSENVEVPSNTTQSVNIIGSLQDIKSGSYYLEIANANGDKVNGENIAVNVKKSVYTSVDEINNRSLEINVDGNIMNISDENEINKVEVYNMEGALMASATDNDSNSISLDIDNVSTGIYVVKVTCGNEVKAKQIVIKK